MAVFAYIVCGDQADMETQLDRLAEFGYDKHLVANSGELATEKVYQEMNPSDIFVARSIKLLGLEIRPLYLFLTRLLAEDKVFVLLDEKLDSRTERGTQFLKDLGVLCEMEQEIADRLADRDENFARNPGRPKITAAQIHQILYLYQNTNQTIRQIAKKVGVSAGTVHKYVKNSEMNLPMGKDRTIVKDNAKE